jgi:nucleotide-binding universal stress UspA family protein
MSAKSLESKPLNANNDKKPVFIVAVDGSPKSFRALTYACEDLVRLHAENNYGDEDGRPRLHVATVVAENSAQTIVDDAHALLARCTDLAEKKSVDVAVHLIGHRKAGVALVQLVDELSAAQIYVGDRRRSSIAVFLLGSCSKYVSENAPKSCVVRIVDTTETFH